jgi:hypothetical protein
MFAIFNKMSTEVLSQSLELMRLHRKYSLFVDAQFNELYDAYLLEYVSRLNRAPGVPVLTKDY